MRSMRNGAHDLCWDKACNARLILFQVQLKNTRLIHVSEVG